MRLVIHCNITMFTGYLRTISIMVHGLINIIRILNYLNDLNINGLGVSLVAPRASHADVQG